MQTPRLTATPLRPYKATVIPSAWLAPKVKTPPKKIQLLKDRDLDIELVLDLTTTEVKVSR